nr:MAG TPA: hypothetical protein [Bacteriophage sp.]DAS29305.1 MAG TPA: hypothetical protein [Caudoviricetes sp.]
MSTVKCRLLSLDGLFYTNLLFRYAIFNLNELF